MNYRPVALTSHLIKIFEKIVKRHIVAYMNDNSLFNPSQHGIRNGRSCLSQLVNWYNVITGSGRALRIENPSLFKMAKNTK